MELKLKDGDYLPDGIGGEERAAGMEEVLARVLFRLSVPRGSFPFLPQLGSELHLLAREKPGAREMAAKQYVAAALAEETALSVERVTLTEQGEGLGTLRVALRYGGESATAVLTVGGE